MLNLITIFKLLLKQVRITNISKFSIGTNSAVGQYSSIIFSSDNSSKSNQSISIGNNAGVGRNCELHVWDHNQIIIKDYATVNDNCKLLGDVIIERYSLLSSNIFASSGNHYAFVDPTRLIKDQDALVLKSSEGKLKHSKPIRVEEDCWIGYGVFIRQGVTIGRGAVIGAYSVVLNDIEPYSVQGGIPSKEIKKRFFFKPPGSIDSSLNEHLPYFYRGFLHKSEILEIGRKQNCIFFRDEAIAILEGVNSDFTIQIIGFKSSDVDVDLIITYQNKLQWNLKISTDKFNLNLNSDSAVPLTSDVCINLFNSLKKQMHKYAVLSFYVVNADSIEHLGIQSIKIHK